MDQRWLACVAAACFFWQAGCTRRSDAERAGAEPSVATSLDLPKEPGFYLAEAAQPVRLNAVRSRIAGSLVDAILGFSDIPKETAVKGRRPTFVEVGAPSSLALTRLRYEHQRDVAALIGTTPAQIDLFVPSGTIAVSATPVPSAKEPTGRMIRPVVDLAPGIYAWVPTEATKNPGDSLQISQATDSGARAGYVFVVDPIDPNIRLGIEWAVAGHVDVARRIWGEARDELLGAHWHDALSAAMPTYMVADVTRWARITRPSAKDELRTALQVWAAAYNRRSYTEALQAYRPKGRKPDAAELRAVETQLTDVSARCGNLLAEPIQKIETDETGAVVTVSAQYEKCGIQKEITRFLPADSGGWLIDAFLDNG